MVGTEALISFLIALFFLEITPGPDMMFVIGRGISEGRKIALLTVFGMVFVSGILQVALLVLGLGSLLQTYPPILISLRWFGAAYLSWLGIQMLGTCFQRKTLIIVDSKISGWSAVRDGTINNLTNPKSFLFMFAFLPQFVDPT
jgi:threonine/homoserine/homoserine lactone efflux protein